MEIEKKSKFLNRPITLDLNDELVRSSSSKRKEGSTMKVDEIKIYKRRKVKDGISFHVLARPIKPPRMQDNSPNELFFRINHTTLRYGIQEFAIITGLNCFVDKDDFLFDTSEPNRLINQYFEGKSIIRKAELISKYKNKIWGDGNDDDAIKFAILYFISTFIYSGEKKSSSIPKIQFDLVESGRYHEYPWGKDVFSKLVKSIKKKMDAKKKYYRIDGMPLAMQIWIYECCSAVDLNIAEKKTNRIPRLEIAFYQLPSKSDAIPENTFQKVGDKDDDFTSKPPSHKPDNKEKGKRKVIVSLSTSIKKFNMHSGSSCKEKSPPVLHGYRKAKSTPFSYISTPVENNVPVHELHNQPDDSANTTPPKSSKQPQDTKAGEIGVLRQDLASFKDSVTNEFKELRLFILENFKQVMDAVNKSNPQSGAPCQIKHNNDRTFRFVLEEHVKNNVQENYQPAQIHIQDPLLVHEQSNNKQPVGMSLFETGDINALHNDGIQQPQSQFELLDRMFFYDTTPVPVQRTRRPDRWNSSSYSINFGSSSGSSSNVVKIYEKKHPFVSDFIRGPYNYDLFDDYAMLLREGLLVRHMNKMHDEDRYKNKKAVLAVDMDLVGSEICVANVERGIRDYINGYRLMAAIPWNTIDNVFIPVNVEQKNHWVLAVLSIVEQRIYVYDSYRATGHNSYVRDEIQKFAQLLPMYVSMEIANHSDDTQDQDIAYDVTYVEDIPQQGSGDLDCGIYLLAFAEYLSEGEGIPVQYLDSNLYRIRYGALLWQYATKKMEEWAVSENEAPPRMMRPPTRIDNSQLVRID
ncbi:hypothetical protein H5410_052223 [Solanum commersonii]|uniref:Ubiquitin-like protease family profile domain-containing protein n=1 Tax=Solanum commersonii TaxID=4109 RepID=A0A9J5X2S2_SOLCO|nr:hypothetical protein H5410_052223 [Solanum commersonii]